jgi:hypothetical protein
VSRYENPEVPTDGLNSMTMEQLSDKNGKQLSMKIGWDRKGYRKEIHMREQELREDSQYGTEGTLYNTWA